MILRGLYDCVTTAVTNIMSFVMVNGLILMWCSQEWSSYFYYIWIYLVRTPACHIYWYDIYHIYIFGKNHETIYTHWVQMTKSWSFPRCFENMPSGTDEVSHRWGICLESHYRWLILTSAVQKHCLLSCYIPSKLVKQWLPGGVPLISGYATSSRSRFSSFWESENPEVSQRHHPKCTQKSTIYKDDYPKYSQIIYQWSHHYPAFSLLAFLERKVLKDQQGARVSDGLDEEALGKGGYRGNTSNLLGNDWEICWEHDGKWYYDVNNKYPNTSNGNLLLEKC